MVLKLGVWMAVEAGEGTGRACMCIAGAQKCEERVDGYPMLWMS